MSGILGMQSKTTELIPRALIDARDQLYRSARSVTGRARLHRHSEVNRRPAALKSAAANTRRVVAFNANHVLTGHRERRVRGGLAVFADRGRVVVELHVSGSAELRHRHALARRTLKTTATSAGSHTRGSGRAWGGRGRGGATGRRFLMTIVAVEHRERDGFAGSSRHQLCLRPRRRRARVALRLWLERQRRRLVAHGRIEERLDLVALLESEDALHRLAIG